ncbi:MAG: MCE family protein [Elusimicrobia bacterium]|nr:MCE family protein [Elusimicrobiota bacterium]
MNHEARVGIFVLLGLLLTGLAIFLLGDFTLQKQYTLYVTFNDVSGLAEKAPVKVSGVEVGRVTDIRLEGSGAKVVARVREGVPVYRDSKITVGSTGIIGSQYLEIDQGTPAAGAWPPGSVVQGIDPVSIQRALTKALASMQDLMDGLAGKDGKETPLTKNINQTVVHLRDTMDNLRSMTANLDEMIGDTKPALTNAMQRTDEITKKLDDILAKVDKTATAVSDGKGAVGALLTDQKMKDDVKKTVADAREAVGGVKDIIDSFTRFRIFWNYDYRYEDALHAGRSDVGIKIQPRADRYYYVGAENLGNPSDAVRANDFQQQNRIDALLGFKWPSIDLGVGVLRSGGGARLTYTPFEGDPFWGRFSVFGQGYDFGRDRIVNGRHMKGAEYDAGGMARLTKLVGIGARVDDISQVSRYQTWVNISFEDKDLANLFGLVSFGAAGKKGRGK